MKIEKFENILSWQKAKILSIHIYKAFDSNTDYSFKNQIQKASISIMNNIAEGFERGSKKEYIEILVSNKIQVICSCL